MKIYFLNINLVLEQTTELLYILKTCITKYVLNKKKKIYSSANGRFRVETTEVRRVHVHSSLLVVVSNQNASNKKKIV